MNHMNPVMMEKCENVLKDEIRALNFAILDLKLYLDTHPHECEKINIYNCFVEKYKMLLDEYQDKYGPMVCELCTSGYPWEWDENGWPWDYTERMGGY